MKNVALTIVFLLVLIAGGYYFLQKPIDSPQTPKEAIQQAKEYRPENGCTQALVPSIHKATGAKHTFSSGCLAPGWEPEN